MLKAIACPALSCPVLSVVYCPSMFSPALFCAVRSRPALSYSASSCPVSGLSSPGLVCRFLAWFFLSCSVLSLPVLPCCVLSCRVIFSNIPSCPGLSSRFQRYPVRLSRRVRDSPLASWPVLYALSGQVRSYLKPHPVLSCPAMSLPVLVCPALAWPGLYCSVVFHHVSALPYLVPLRLFFLPCPLLSILVLSGPFQSCLTASHPAASHSRISYPDASFRFQPCPIRLVWSCPGWAFCFLIHIDASNVNERYHACLSPVLS